MADLGRSERADYVAQLPLSKALEVLQALAPGSIGDVEYDLYRLYLDQAAVAVHAARWPKEQF